MYLQRPDIKRSVSEQADISDVNINDIINWVISLSKAGNDKIDIILKTSNPNLLIKGNINYLRQAVLNVIFNAVKYSYIYEDKGQPWVDVKLVASEGFATITVQNCGTPITEEELKKGLCFQPFYIGTHAAKEGHDGTGLGLAVTRRIVDMFNGNIAIESLPAAYLIAGSQELQPYVTTVTLQFPLSDHIGAACRT